jgi:N-methylhydantoinase B
MLSPTMWLTTCVERSVIPPYGLCGGEDGKTYTITLERDGKRERVPGKANVMLRQGDLVTMESCGGGGFGAPDGGSRI